MKTLVATAFAAALVGFAAPAARAEVIREQSRATVDAAGLDRLRVENARGEVDVRPSTDGRIHIVALKIARSPSGSVARELADRTVVETERDGDDFRVRVRYPSHKVRVTVWDTSVRLPSVEVRLAIEIPSRMGLNVSTASGRLLTFGLGGDQYLRSASGEVQIEAAEGAAEVSTASGDVTAIDVASTRLATVSGDVSCERASGPLRVSSTSGDVTIQGARDSVRVTTVGGDVRVERAPRGLQLKTTSGAVEVGMAAGRVVLSSVSGDAEVTLAAPLRASELGTQSGALTVRMEPDVACALEARTTSGEIDFRLPVQARTLSRGRVSAVIRGGSVPVSLRSVSGDIMVLGGGRR